jgi:NADH dehydrogenase
MSSIPNTAIRPRVVIIGCGFGGLEAARALHGSAIDVTVVDKTNHHLFQPLLYQVATAGLSAPAIAAPVRHLFRKQPNVTTLLGEVERIDIAARSVLLQGGDALPYDHLIVAAGATHSYFGRDDWAPFAPGLKTLDDAFEIRRRILLAFEAAEREGDPARRAAWLNFVVVGGGPTGVEMAGTLAEIARHTLPGEFRHIDPASAKIILLEGGTRVLQAMPEALSQRAKEQLEKLGVEVRVNARVTAIDATGLTVAGAAPGADPMAASYAIPSQCIVWAAGVAASPLGRLLAEATGCTTEWWATWRGPKALCRAWTPRPCPASRRAPSRWAAPQPPTCCAAWPANPPSPSATATTATSPPSAATPPWWTSPRPWARCAFQATSPGCSGSSPTSTSSSAFATAWLCSWTGAGPTGASRAMRGW